jgi:hypothetical protein
VKRLLLASILLGLGLSNCGGGSSNPTPPPTTQTAPAITSASSATFTEATAGSFTVTATGSPAPSITESGALPGGVSFSADILSGTPTASGTFPIVFTASNGASPNATQNFTLTVNAPATQAPAITSASSTAFTEGTAGSFTVTATGTPAPSITEAGALPSGVTFNAGTLSGTPSASGVFPITFTAANGVSPNATQNFTLTVNAPATQAPAIISASSTAFTEGTAGSFTVTATGTPAPSITEAGALPSGVTFNAGTLSGTPSASGVFPITFTAANGVSPNATQSFTLTVTPSPSSSSVSGTAAAGSPIVGATVTLKDSAGNSSTATTAADGTYTLDTAGFTPPFLIQVQAPSGNLYSVSADALTTTIINAHPFTDLIIRSWYSAQGVSIDTAFTNPVSMPAPTPTNVQILNSAVTNLAQLWLTNAGVNTAQFNLISSPFAANGTGLDQVLDETTVNTSTGTVTIAGTIGTTATTQASTITYNTSANTMTVASTTTNANGTTASSNTTVVPTQTPQQTALNSIASTLTGLVNAVNSNGSQLTAAEITPFLSTDLLNDGLDQTQYAAMWATDVRGVTWPYAQIQSVNSIDLVNGIADIVINTGNQGSGLPELWFENVNGTWLIGGDKRIAQIGFQVANRVHQGAPMSDGGSGGSGVAIGGNVTAPDGILTGVTVTDASGVTGWNATPLPEGDIEVETFQPTPTTQLTVDLRQFDNGWTDLGSNIIPPGTLFTIALTPASGPVVDYTWTNNAFTTESISITSPTSGSLADYTLGQPQSVSWTLPTTFPVAGVYLHAETYTTSTLNEGPSTYQCEIVGQTNAPTGAGAPTSGTITVPSTCNNQPVVFVELEVMVEGINGEIEEPTVNIQ